MKNKITVGIDIGSLSADGVALYNNEIIAEAVLPTGASSSAAGEEVYDRLCADGDFLRDDVSRVVTTGYGRHSTSFSDRAVTEITAHALGARYLFGDARTIIDIGGQDCKVILLETDGRVADFAMNDKCAAGCGRFLEVMARSLGVRIEDMGDIALQSKKDLTISGICTVFAESEVIGLVAKGADRADIIKALHNLVAQRIVAMTTRMKARAPFVLSGGVGKNGGVARALSQALDEEMLLPDNPQLVGALGAAIIATEFII